MDESQRYKYSANLMLMGVEPAWGYPRPPVKTDMVNYEQ